MRGVSTAALAHRLSWLRGVRTRTDPPPRKRRLRARQGARREDGMQADEGSRVPEARDDQTPRCGRCDACRDWPLLQCEPLDDFETRAIADIAITDLLVCASCTRVRGTYSVLASFMRLAKTVTAVGRTHSSLGKVRSLLRRPRGNCLRGHHLGCRSGERNQRC